MCVCVCFNYYYYLVIVAVVIFSLFQVVKYQLVISYELAILFYKNKFMPMAVSDFWHPQRGVKLWDSKLDRVVRENVSKVKKKKKEKKKRKDRYIQVLTFWAQLCYVESSAFLHADDSSSLRETVKKENKNNNNKYAWLHFGSQSSTSYVYK